MPLLPLPHESTKAVNAETFRRVRSKLERVAAKPLTKRTIPLGRLASFLLRSVAMKISQMPAIAAVSRRLISETFPDDESAVAERAYAKFEARGRIHGFDKEDWSFCRV